MASSEGHVSRLPLRSYKATKPTAPLPTPTATPPPPQPAPRLNVFERLSKPSAPRIKQGLQPTKPAPFRPFLARLRPQKKDLRTAVKPTKPAIKTRSTPLQHIPQYAHDAGAWTSSTASTNAHRSPRKSLHAASREASFLQSESGPLDAEAAEPCSIANPPQDQYRRKARDILSSMRADLRSDVSSWRSSRDCDNPNQACSKLDELSLTTKGLVAKGRKALATITSGRSSDQGGCKKISDQGYRADDDETLVDHEHDHLSFDESEDDWADDELASSDSLDPAPPEVPYEQENDVLGLVDEYINDVYAMWQHAVPDKEQEAEANIPASFDFGKSNEEQRPKDVEHGPKVEAQSVEIWSTPQEHTDTLLSRWSEPPEDIERYSPECMQTRSILEFNDDLVPYVHKDGYGIEDEKFDDRAHSQSDRIQIVRIKVESPRDGPAPIKEVDASELSPPGMDDTAKTGEEGGVVTVSATTDGKEQVQR